MSDNFISLNLDSLARTSRTAALTVLRIDQLNYLQTLAYARSLIGNKEYQSAQSLLANSLHKYPTSGEIHYLEGVALRYQKKWWQSEDKLERAIELGFNTKRPYMHLGYAAFRMGHYLRALEAFTESANQWSSKSTDAKALMYYMAGLSAEKSNLQQQSTLNYQKAITIDETIDSKTFGIGVFHERRGLHDMAYLAYIKIADHTPTPDHVRSEVYYRAAVAQSKNHAIDSAIELSKKSISLDAVDAQKYYHLGKALELQGLYEEALSFHVQGLARSVDFDLGWYTRTIHLHTRLGYHDTALSILDELDALHETGAISFSTDGRNTILKRAYLSFYEKLPISSHTILYEGFHGQSISENPLSIYLGLLKDKKYKNWKHVFVIDNFKNIPTWMRKDANNIFVPRLSFLYYKYLATASHLINNTTFPPIFIRKEGQQYLNTWHGVPWKTLGKDIRGAFSENKNTQRNLLQATHLISPNPHTTNVLLDSYDIRGIFPGKLAEIGYPRVDTTLNMKTKEKLSLKKRLGIDNNKKTILYAPTWRGTLAGLADETSDLKKTLQALRGLDCNIIFRGHTLHSKSINKEFLSSVSAPDDISSNELLGVADILITDYSSIGFDFLATKKPILYYLADYDKYSTDRGLYFSHTKLPGEKAFSLQELIDNASKELSRLSIPSDHYLEAVGTFCPNDDGESSRKVMEFFMGGSNKNVIDITTKKKKVLIYPGGLETNGITISAISLLKNIDSSKYDVFIIITPEDVELQDDKLKNFKKIPSSVRIIMRTHGMCMSKDEASYVRKFNYPDEGSQLSTYEPSLKSAFGREYRRVFGDTAFDYAIEFGGYSRFWSGLLGIGAKQNSPQIRNASFLHSDMKAEQLKKFSYLMSIFWAYAFFDSLTSVSEEINRINIENIATKYSIPKSKFNYVDNTIDINKIIKLSKEDITPDLASEVFPDDEIVFICIGRISLEKGQIKLLDAFEQIHKEHPNTRLVFIGDGPMYQKLVSLVNTKNLEKVVYILGRKENPYKYLARSDCLVLPSEHEGQGLVLLEAMTLNKPVVATDLPAFHELMKDHATLVDNSAQGLVGGMLEFIQNPHTFPTFDIESYQKQAVDMFHKKILDA